MIEKIDCKCKAKKVITVTELSNGKIVSFKLCQDCAHTYVKEVEAKKPEKIDLPAAIDEAIAQITDEDLLNIVNEVLGDITEDKASFLQALNPSMYTTGKKTCPKCGATTIDILKKSRLGCAHCYNIFAKEIAHSIAKYQAGSKHTGKKINKKLTEQPKSKAQLKEDMALAIMVEDYEWAAKLRDELKKLE